MTKTKHFRDVMNKKDTLTYKDIFECIDGDLPPLDLSWNSQDILEKIKDFSMRSYIGLTVGAGFLIISETNKAGVIRKEVHIDRIGGRYNLLEKAFKE